MKRTTIDAKKLGWFWAVNRHREYEYYKKFYGVSEESDKSFFTPNNLGRVIMFNFLSQQEELLGRLIMNYTRSKLLCDYETFGDEILNNYDNPHKIYEIIWASFKCYVFSIEEIAELFGMTDPEVRAHYKKYDSIFKEEDENEENLADFEDYNRGLEE